jgi:hypothetical protein
MLKFKRGGIDADELTLCRKKNEKLAARVDGPFQVETPHGLVGCEDGYVVMEDDGNIGLMEKRVFEKQFEPVDGEIMSVLSDNEKSPTPTPTPTPTPKDENFLNDTDADAEQIDESGKDPF